PYPMGYEEEGFGGNMAFDYEEGDWYTMEPTGGQWQNNHGNQQPYHNGGQNGYQNGGNHGQNHNRNNNQAPYRPPNQLCRRFGLRNDCSFDTFEFDFKLACKMHQIPARDKVDWLLMHLEGAIKEHAMSWIESRGEENQPTYAELIGELRPSFQQKMSKEIAERQLVGRKWNLFTSVDTFLHETRKLVQCALPGLTQQWSDRICSCLIQALPASWDQSLSCSDKTYPQMVEWIRAQAAKIQNTPQSEWEEWVKVAHRQHLQAGGNSNGKSTPNSNPQPQKCYHCGNFGHKSINCGFHHQQQQQNRSQGPPPYAQNQNWRPPSQNQNYNQSNGSNSSNFGQNQ
ncbi:MAG: hypothetical protein GY821_02510, partial [Gammaproteobacteria bacterium]|nr:hypothetical protein [Gammaproteobacteria bacterium]